MGLSVVMPALEMAQETGKLGSWKKKAGGAGKKGGSLLEVETEVQVETVVLARQHGTPQVGGDLVAAHDVAPWVDRPLAGEQALRRPAQHDRGCQWLDEVERKDEHERPHQPDAGVALREELGANPLVG